MSEGELTNGEIARALGRIEKKLDDVTSDHERRIRAMERWVWVAAGGGFTGAATGLTSLLGG